MGIRERRIICCPVGAVVLLAGCVAPPRDGLTGKPVSGGMLLLGTKAFDSCDPRCAGWLPACGRMDAAARKRHLPPDSTWEAVLAEGLDRPGPEGMPGWRSVGAPITKAVRLGGESGIELSAPDDATGTCGLERDLDATLLAGRDVRAELRLTCRSIRRLAALQGMELSLLVRDRTGQARTLVLPITADVTPGWETQNWWLRFHPTVATVCLRIHATRPGAALTLDSIRVLARPTLPERGSVPTTAPAAPPLTSAGNLISGGSFETGQAAFYTSAAGRWPNDEPMPAPLAWTFDQSGIVGRHALRLYVTHETGRVAFGPLDLTRPGTANAANQRWHLSFYARSTQPTTVTTLLRSCYRTLGRETFQLSPRWYRFSHTFALTALTFDEKADLTAVELSFDFAGDQSHDPNQCWLDAVVLAGAPIESRYLPPAPVQVGLVGPAIDPADLSNIVSEKEAVTFGIRLVADPSQAKEVNAKLGKLAIDVLDVWDRAVWTRTTKPVIPTAGVLEDKVQLPLPRGYYRVLATLWTGEPGESTIISRSSLRLAVIAVDDPVPHSNPFGLTTDGANVSLRTTQLGAGWVRMDLAARRLQVAPGTWDFSTWASSMARCRRGEVEVVVGLTLPNSTRAWRLFLTQWLTDTVVLPIGVVISPPAISVQPVEAYNARLALLRQQLRPINEKAAARGQTVKVVRDLFASSGSGEGPVSPADGPLADVVGIACTETVLPEATEPLLEGTGRQRPAGVPLWDLAVPVRIGGDPGLQLSRPARGLDPGPGPLRQPGGSIRQLTEPIDPVRSASRMVRSLLIRFLAGAELVCCDALALSPVRSIHQDDHRRLHENDLSPRAALVAFDLMASLLNDATLVRWIDEPTSRTRVLYFEKDDGRALAAVWRPFGLSPTRLSLADVPASIEVIDVAGLPVPAPVRGNRRIIESSEIVRYLLAPAGQGDALRQSLDTIEVAFEPTSQPGR